jgi:chemotaxis protein histidine kinase CheA
MPKKTINLRNLGRMTGLLCIMIAIGAALPALWIPDSVADPALDTTALAKQIDQSLRAAERDMFSGKNDSADQQLNAIEPQIEQLKAADPSNPKLKSLESKYAQTRKNLDRKLGVTSTTAASTTSSTAPTAPDASTPAEAPTQAEAPPAAAAAPAQTGLPRAIQSDMANVRAKLDEAESKWAEDGRGGSTISGATDPRAIKLEAVEQPLNSAVYYYGNILKKCDSQSSPCDPGHPDIAALKVRIDAMQANVEGLNREIADAAAADAAAAEEESAQAEAAQAECEGWQQRMQVYTEGDKALYRCVGADEADMPGCKSHYDEAINLLAEFGDTPWAAEPCGALHSTLSDLNRYMENFAASYASYSEEQAAAKANMGEIVFSRQPINPGNPSDLTSQFAAGDNIYGLIRTTKPWSDIYRSDTSADVMVNVKLDGEKIHAQFVKLKSPELLAQQHLVFEIAPEPGKMTAYSDPNRQYGSSTATLRQGPNELTDHLARLGPGQHTMAFDVTYFGTVWSAGSFTITGDDFRSYAALHQQIAEGVSQSVTLPMAQMTNKTMVTEMQSLLVNAGWENIHRINIVDKDWWIDRISGGDSPENSRHVAAAALARDEAGYYYRVCTFHQDKLLTGGYGELYLSHQGDRVPIPEANIDK